MIKDLELLKFDNAAGIIYKGKQITLMYNQYFISTCPETGDLYDEIHPVTTPAANIKLSNYSLIDVLFFFCYENLIKENKITKEELEIALEDAYHL